MRPRTRKLRRAALIAVGVLLALEVVLRVAGHYYSRRFWEEGAFARRFSQQDLVILAIGESTTAGVWVPREDSYPSQLQRSLRAHYGTDRIHVVVPPHIGQNTSQMVRKFDKYLGAFRPALVILMAGVNNGWSLAESNLGDFMPPGDWRTFFFRLRSWSDDVKVVRLFRLFLSSLHEVPRSLQAELEDAPRYTDWPPRPDPLVRGIGQETFMRLWRSDMERMIGATTASGARVLLMTYPNYESPPVSGFRALAEKHSLPLVENHGDFAALLREGRGEEVFCSDFRHPNAAGYAIIAANALERIVETGFLDREIALRSGARAR